MTASLPISDPFANVALDQISQAGQALAQYTVWRESKPGNEQRLQTIRDRLARLRKARREAGKLLDTFRELLAAEAFEPVQVETDTDEITIRYRYGLICSQIYPVESLGQWSISCDPQTIRIGLASLQGDLDEYSLDLRKPLEPNTNFQITAGQVKFNGILSTVEQSDNCILSLVIDARVVVAIDSDDWLGIED